MSDLNCIRNVARIEKVIRALQYSDGTYSLYGEDQAFANWVYEQKGLFALSRAMMVGDEMVIIDAPLKEYEGRIKRVNKHK